MLFAAKENYNLRDLIAVCWREYLDLREKVIGGWRNSQIEDFRNLCSLSDSNVRIDRQVMCWAMHIAPMRKTINLHIVR